MENGALQPDIAKPTIVVGNRPGFKNQGVIKSAARQIILEALTAFKGGKVGKRGLLVRAMAHLETSFESPDPEVRQWATEQVLKMANGMTKDDKSSGLEELLKGGANVQINFNTHFSQRSASNQANPAGQGLTIGFTPPPGSGEAPPA